MVQVEVTGSLRARRLLGPVVKRRRCCVRIDIEKRVEVKRWGGASKRKSPY
jgi:hypothetical protein